MKQKEKENFKKNLGNQLKEYIHIIIKEYKDSILPEDLYRLKQIKNYEDCIVIDKLGTITCFGNRVENKVYFPIEADNILKKLRFIPGYGIDKQQKAYKNDNIVINDNTFNDFMKHAFISGMKAKDYYEENLLHETMHFCGSGGSDPLLEGLTEYKTRKIAQKYNFKTTGCGYPEEVKIVEQLHQIFDEKFCNLYLFDRGGPRSWKYLGETFGVEAQEFMKKLHWAMLDEFNQKYYKNIENFSGLFGPFKKTNAYSKINYEEVYKLIEEYKNRKENTNNIISNDEEKDKNEEVINTEEKTKIHNLEEETKEEIHVVVDVSSSPNIEELIDEKIKSKSR